MDILDDMNKYKKLCDLYEAKLNKSTVDSDINDLNAKVEKLIQQIYNLSEKNKENELFNE